MRLRVLYEDNHLLAVDKPARLLVQGDQTGEPNLVELAEHDRIEREHKPGKAFVGLVHRLDRPVSGVVVLAKTSKAAARLSEAFRSRAVSKTYLAILQRVSPTPTPLADAVWRDVLLKDAEQNKAAIVPAGTPGSKSAKTRLRVLTQDEKRAFVEFTPVTGRHHQLRAQAAARGWPIVGDVKYGSRRGWEGAIALHASRLETPHPTRDEPVRIEAPLPGAWEVFGPLTDPAH